MPMPKNKCYGCPDRHVGCQVECESYLTYATECERIRRNRVADYAYYGYAKQQSDKACRIHFGKASYK
jgi:hypothetical protein